MEINFKNIEDYHRRSNTRYKILAAALLTVGCTTMLICSKVVESETVKSTLEIGSGLLTTTVGWPVKEIVENMKRLDIVKILKTEFHGPPPAETERQAEIRKLIDELFTK